MKRFTPWIFIAGALFGLLDSQVLLYGQNKKPAPLSELAAYTGADREQVLVSGAKAEGKVVWYTSLAGSSYKELAQGFEKKYPGIKVDVYRAASNELMARITAEAKAPARGCITGVSTARASSASVTIPN